MNQNEKTKIGEYWFGLAQMYGKDLSRTALKIMVDAIDDLASDEVLKTLHDWSKKSKLNRHPLPGEIREIVSKELSPDARSKEIASRIPLAITKYGWADPDGARAFMGELAWDIVNRNGGWLYICENHGVDLNPLTFHAQARDMAKSLIEHGSLGMLEQPIGLTHSPKKVELGLQKTDVLSLIQPRKNEP